MINPDNITTVRVGELPISAISLTDKIPFETADEFLKHNTIQELVNFISIRVSTIQFQIVDLWVTNQYISDNLEVSGLGKNFLLGFALCNGQNGTPNLDGQTLIGYGVNYPNIGGFGGSPHAVLVSHNHNYKKAITGRGYDAASDDNPLTALTDDTTSTVGVSGTNKNMQPYMVALKLIKL